MSICQPLLLFFRTNAWMNNLWTGRQREVEDTLLDRSRLVKNAAVLRFFCARRAERIKYRRFSKSCKVSPTSLWLITLSFTILIAPHQFFYFRETFSGRRERTFFLTGFEKRRYLIFPAGTAQKNLSTATFFIERKRPDREKVRSLQPSGFFCFVNVRQNQSLICLASWYSLEMGSPTTL